MAHYEERLWRGSPTGATRAERSSCRYRAYVPDPLIGRSLTLTAQQAADIADVEAAIVRLNASEPAAVSLEALARLLLRAEAAASSFIEGLRVNVRRLAKEEVVGQAGLRRHDETARAVLGNVRAIESALELADPHRPVNVADIRSLHARLLEGTRDERLGGQVRRDQNWIGGSGLTPCSAEFVPPPPEFVEDLLVDLCDYMSGDDHPTLMQAAMVHAQFETIHPFADGNGRTGRALIHVVLRRRGLAPRYVPPISLALATHSNEYIGALTAYRHDGPVDSPSANAAAATWLDRFLADTIRACDDASRFSDQLVDLEYRWRDKVGRVRAGSATDLLLSALPAAPVLTVATAAELIGRSLDKTNDAVNRLVEAGVLRQTTVGRRNRAFEVPDLLAAITGFERALASPVGDTAQEPPVRPVPARR